MPTMPSPALSPSCPKVQEGGFCLFLFPASSGQGPCACLASLLREGMHKKRTTTQAREAHHCQQRRPRFHSKGEVREEKGQVQGVACTHNVGACSQANGSSKGWVVGAAQDREVGGGRQGRHGAARHVGKGQGAGRMPRHGCHAHATLSCIIKEPYAGCMHCHVRMSGSLSGRRGRSSHK